LTFRSQASPAVVSRTLDEVFGQVAEVRLDPKGHGSKGFEETGAIFVGDLLAGQYGTGGASQRGWSSFSITGQGCEWVKRWDEAVESLEGIDYQVRRADLAVDTFRGEVTHQRVVQGHASGLFTTGGRPPKLMRIESWPREDGWTAYVGSREQGKFFRGYEKGFEQVAKFRLVDGLVPVSVDGHAIEDWYRCEVELKAKDRGLPEDLIENRDEYFAGAYPFCRELVEAKPFELCMSRDRRPQLEMAAALACIQHQWGRALFTALMAYQGDIGLVWSKIVGEEHSERLVKAGVLMVEHEG
jgi:phage replication initiation protein